MTEQKLPPLVASLGIIGLGQMGASLALAARAAGIAPHLYATDTTQAHLDYGLQQGMMDAALTLEELASRCELIVIAVPPTALAAVTRALLPHLQENAVVTDIASVKLPITELLEAEYPTMRAFIPAHPIAGGTKAGATGGNGAIFARKLAILTPRLTSEQPDANLALVTAFWERLGMTVELMPADVHDLIYGHVSHLPHLIAFAAAASFQEISLPQPLPDTLRRFLRLAESDAALWSDIILSNPRYVSHALENYRVMIQHVTEELSQGAAEELTAEQQAFAQQVLFPRIAASCLIATVSVLEQQSGQRLARYSGAGFADIASPAAADDPDAPEGDLAKISAASAEVATMLQGFETQLKKLAAAIESGNAQALQQLLEAMQINGNHICE
jgi:prephenate dehydrogenase